jgi:hypothetical protein
MLNLAVVTKTIQLDTIKLSSSIGEKHFRGPKVGEKPSRASMVEAAVRYFNFATHGHLLYSSTGSK